MIDEFVRKSKGSAADALKRVSANRWAAREHTLLFHLGVFWGTVAQNIDTARRAVNVAMFVLRVSQNTRCRKLQNRTRRDTAARSRLRGQIIVTIMLARFLEDL